MEGQLPFLVQALAAWVLLPLLLAGTLASGWGTRRGRLGLALVFTMGSGLGALVGSGMVLPREPRRLLQMIETARTVPPEVFGAMIPPQLAGMVQALCEGGGRPIAPAELQAEVARLMALLAQVRGLPPEALAQALPMLVHRLLFEGTRPGLLAGLAWSPQADPMLGLAVAAGLVGGAPVGLATGAIGALARSLVLGADLHTLVPTLLAGLLGALLRRLRGPAPLGVAPALGVGALCGAAQLATVVLAAPLGYLEPAVLVGGLVLALGQGTSLAVFELARARHELEARARAAREAEVQGRLALLTAQVRPHFLFNSLNTVASACADDPALARHLVDCLARFLRRSLGAERMQVTVEEELADLEPYLELVRARFPDRLQVRVEAEPGARARRIPGLVLQPLVENALEHGMRADGAVLHVVVAARLDGPTLRLAVRDDGRGLSPAARGRFEARRGLGIGLESVLARIEGGTPPGTLRLLEVPGGGLDAVLEVPAP